ncbi:type II toxin-antitoxin system RelE/ParE family toxin [Superficieibacter sp.]|uniref:type II toxin-antitoxin system RelE/ParE family toxin n=1 Tax=Superficieibacter sp. TaxID=2303322 RepID=UPI0028B2481F|nr:type II toxin-antitoxin system RelE/ParE family toxin [Superficieibacter sp.]
MGYRLTAEAQRDLKEILEFTEQKWGRKKSQEYFSRIREILSRLAEMPEIGQPRYPELSAGTYSFPCVSHMIYYLIEDSELVVLAVLHQRQLPAHHLLTR